MRSCMTMDLRHPTNIANGIKLVSSVRHSAKLPIPAIPSLPRSLVCSSPSAKETPRGASPATETSPPALPRSHTQFEVPGQKKKMSRLSTTPPRIVQIDIRVKDSEHDGSCCHSLRLSVRSGASFHNVWTRAHARHSAYSWWLHLCCRRFPSGPSPSPHSTPLSKVLVEPRPVNVASASQRLHQARQFRALPSCPLARYFEDPQRFP